MALVLPHSIFFHVGRTAGHCVRKTIREMRIPTYEAGAFHDWPSNIQLTDEEKQKLFFCFVRHPLAWLKSFWCHQMQFGWSESDFASQVQSDSFAEFLDKAVAAYPDGPASHAFRPFLLQCREIGRQEDLTADLRRILERAGERVVPEILEQMGVTTVEIDREIRDAATAPQPLLKKVLHAERDLCHQFDYDSIPAGMIGPSHTCLATYVPLGQSSRPFTLDPVAAQDIENAFSIDGRGYPGPQHRRRTTLAIRRTMESIDFNGKDVIDVGCTDGVFCFHAESRGAHRVVGVARPQRSIVDRLKQDLDSNVDFVTHGVYGVEQAVSGRFDVAFCLRWLQMTRHPLLLIRTLSRLMKQGGTLVLSTDYLDCYPGVPLIYTPLGSESPTSAFGCTYFNKEGLLNALASYGFHDFVIAADLEQGIDTSRDFARMPFPDAGVLHDSESLVGNITLSCTWSPDAADEDPRYSLDRVSHGLLTDFWDRQLPAAGIPENPASEEAIHNLRRHVNMLTRTAARLKEQLDAATAGAHDRENDLQSTRRELVDRTAELVEVRDALVDRTTRLEQAEAMIHDRTVELAETRRILAERTALLERRVAETDVLQATLVDRTTRLEQAEAAIHDRTVELAETRRILAERTSTLERHIAETDVLQATLVDRTTRLEQAERTIQDRTAELADVRQTLGERTVLLERRLADVEALQATLADRTTRLAHAEQAIQDRTTDLIETRQLLVERTAALEQTLSREAALLANLAESRAALDAASAGLEEVIHTRLGRPPIIATRRLLAALRDEIRDAHALLLAAKRDASDGSP
jgi:SAM-dependent methyltransferase